MPCFLKVILISRRLSGGESLPERVHSRCHRRRQTFRLFPPRLSTTIQHTKNGTSFRRFGDMQAVKEASNCTIDQCPPRCIGKCLAPFRVSAPPVGQSPPPVAPSRCLPSPSCAALHQMRPAPAARYDHTPSLQMSLRTWNK